MSALKPHTRCTAPACPSSSSALCRRPAPVCRLGGRSDLIPSWSRAPCSVRTTHTCRAEERSRDSLQTSQAEKLKVPATPPTKDSASQTTKEASTSQQETVEFADDVKLLQRRKREQSQESAPTGYFQGILQEVRLIEWPRPQQALANTVLVIGMVGASSIILFAINSTLAELTSRYYIK